MQIQRCLVIGGGGFLGQHLVERLLKQGFAVSIFDIRAPSNIDPQVTVFVGNLCEKEELMPALKGVDVVFHCATPSPLGGNKQVFVEVNVEGTKTVIVACKAAGVKSLVLTSSASVVYEGQDISNGSEGLPYAAKPMDFYTETKIQQEQLVLAANSPTMSTVALRPHGIFGPRDPHMLPTAIRMARAGKTKFIIGDGKNKVDFTFIENVVEGHIKAAEVVKPGSKTSGKAYNITNDEPVLFWSFMTDIITGLGYPAPSIHLPYWLVSFIALLLHWLCVLLRPLGVNIRPTFTPMTVALAGTHHYYNCNRAKADLGYMPVVSVSEGIRKTLHHFSHLHKDAVDSGISKNSSKDA